MVTCLAFTPRGALLATGSLDKTVKLWETATGRERASLDGNTDGVSALWLCPGRRQMATGGVWRDGANVGARDSDLLAGRLSGLSRRRAKPGLLARWPVSLRAAGTAGTARWDTMTGSPLAPALKDDATAFARAFDGATYATGGE